MLQNECAGGQDGPVSWDFCFNPTCLRGSPPIFYTAVTVKQVEKILLTSLNVCLQVKQRTPWTGPSLHTGARDADPLPSSPNSKTTFPTRGVKINLLTTTNLNFHSENRRGFVPILFLCFHFLISKRELNCLSYPQLQSFSRTFVVVTYYSKMTGPGWRRMHLIQGCDQKKPQSASALARPRKRLTCRAWNRIGTPDCERARTPSSGSKLGVQEVWWLAQGSGQNLSAEQPERGPRRPSPGPACARHDAPIQISAEAQTSPEAGGLSSPLAVLWICSSPLNSHWHVWLSRHVIIPLRSSLRFPRLGFVRVFQPLTRMNFIFPKHITYYWISFPWEIQKRQGFMPPMLAYHLLKCLCFSDCKTLCAHCIKCKNYRKR